MNRTGIPGIDDFAGPEPEAEPVQKSPPVVATPWSWVDPQNISARSWLYGRHVIRKFVSAIVAPGGGSKTSLITAEMLEMVSGKRLLLTGVPLPPLRVWYINLEDPHPRDEIDRRIAAACIAYGLTSADLGDRLFVDSGREQPCVIARYSGRQIVVDEALVRGLIAEIKRRTIDVLTIDPLKRAHEVDENDNSAVDLVVKQLTRIADEGDCAVTFAHHTRKLHGSEASAETSRGGKAIVDGCRAVRVVNTMTAQEAEQAGITEDRWRYFRVFPGKLNLAPPPETSTWYRLESVHLGNAPDGVGDSVGVAMPWSWPDAWAGVTSATLLIVQRRVFAGTWRENVQADDWVGKAVAEVIGLDLDHRPDKARVQSMLRAWIASGALRVVERDDGRRRPKKFVVVGEWAT
jgi:hypothetical protein